MKPTPTIRSRFLTALLALGLALAVLAPVAQAQAAAPVVKAVGPVGFTVGDIDREVEFYTTVLTFEKISDVEAWGSDYERLQSVFGLRMRVVRLRLGEESIELTEYLAPRGPMLAFVAEVFISFLLMSVILRVSNAPALNRYTGLFAGTLVATYITLESPISGMSMNPARTFASAFPGQLWMWLWIYFTAPPLGMLLAAETYLRLKGAHKVYCAKFHHENDKRCIFRCRYGEADREAAAGRAGSPLTAAAPGA